MTIEAEQDVIGLMRAGRVVGLAIRAMQDNLRPGMTTKALDRVGESILQQHGARSAPAITYKFPGATCISINDEAAHGIPGNRVIQDGDLVKIDVSAELDGYFADANLTVPVGTMSRKKQRLIDCTREALDKALGSAKAGRPINEIGRAIESVTRRWGFSVIRELPGHGVGKALHESPSVPNFYVRKANSPLPPGMVITIEPHISAGSWQIETGQDGWTLRTRDRSVVASFEHTVIITDDAPILVTAM